MILLINSFILSAECVETALQIIQKSDDLVRGNTNIAEITMKIQRKKWSREISMKVWGKGYDFSLIVIKEPARDRGSVFLKRKTEVWNFIPSIEKIIKIPPSMMGQSWMGSDFTNDDLVKESSIVHDYNHKILSEEVLNGKKCYKIQLTPKPEAPVVWGKIISWIEHTTYIQYKVEFYDEEGILINTMIASNVKDLGGRLLPSKLEMIPNEKPENKTFLEYKYIIFNEPINNDFFSFKNIKDISYKN
jgi:hypothetical protein